MKYLNMPLLTNPLNWIVVGLMATVWLFALHSVMTAFNSLSGQDAS